MRSIIIFLAVLTISISAKAQKSTLLIGFPEKNFISDGFTIEKLAKKNGTSVQEIDDLYRKSLISNAQKATGKLAFTSSSDIDVEALSSINFSTSKNKKNKEFLSPIPKEIKPELQKIFNSHDCEYIILVTKYNLIRGMGLNMKIKYVHKIDYVVYDRELNYVHGNFIKLKPFFQGTFRPNKMIKSYENFGKKLQKELAGKM